jgi:hypothetical protein
MEKTWKERYRCDKCDFVSDDYTDMQQHECEVA